MVSLPGRRWPGARTLQVTARTRDALKNLFRTGDANGSLLEISRGTPYPLRLARVGKLSYNRSRLPRGYGYLFLHTVHPVLCRLSFLRGLHAKHVSQGTCSRQLLRSRAVILSKSDFFSQYARSTETQRSATQKKCRCENISPAPALPRSQTRSRPSADYGRTWMRPDRAIQYFAISAGLAHRCGRKFCYTDRLVHPAITVAKTVVIGRAPQRCTAFCHNHLGLKSPGTKWVVCCGLLAHCAMVADADTAGGWSAEQSPAVE